MMTAREKHFLALRGEFELALTWHASHPIEDPKVDTIEAKYATLAVQAGDAWRIGDDPTPHIRNIVGLYADRHEISPRDLHEDLYDGLTSAPVIDLLTSELVGSLVTITANRLGRAIVRADTLVEMDEERAIRCALELLHRLTVARIEKEHQQ